MAAAFSFITIPSTDGDISVPIGPLKHYCGKCLASKSNLLQCTGCASTRYCSREHQTQHWQHHKTSCGEIKKLRAKVDEEARLIREADGTDFMMPANASETHVGMFWGIVGTRDYMIARYASVHALCASGTLDGLQSALEHLMDMLRLCRGDNMGVRYSIPAMMLQLDRDQECYDFVKGWETIGRDKTYEVDEMDQPYLDIKDADVFENVDYLCREYGQVHWVSATLLLCLKLLVDIVNLKRVRNVVTERLPSELWSRVDQYICRSSLSQRFAGNSYAELTAAQQRLESHIRVLAEAASDLNEHIFKRYPLTQRSRGSPRALFSGLGGGDPAGAAVQSCSMVPTRRRHGSIEGFSYPCCEGRRRRAGRYATGSPTQTRCAEQRGSRGGNKLASFMVGYW